MGSDRTAQTESRYNPDFNPRSLCGERPWAAGCAGSQGRISIHTPRVGSDHGDQIADTEYDISIHAPRVGSDFAPGFLRRTGRHFNPRSPCGERRRLLPGLAPAMAFQSTLPVWGATAFDHSRCAAAAISIHAPRVGSDQPGSRAKLLRRYFNPRSPCGERQVFAVAVPFTVYFNPRSPCGERRADGAKASVGFQFQSTLPVWGATRDCWPLSTASAFQSTLPAWGATPVKPGEADERNISIHAPRVGSDLNRYCRLAAFAISIHAPRVGSDLYFKIVFRFFFHFNPRSPCGERQREAEKKVRARQISIHAPRVGSDTQDFRIGQII